MEKLEIGERIPAFKVKDHKGLQVTDKDVLGTPTVIYFYPKDETPGCTKQACEIRDNLKKLRDLGIYVLGVSPDSVEKHQKFITNQKLNFTLLSDPQLEMCHGFGVIQDGKFVRSTFCVNSMGKITYIERHVKVEGHLDRIIKAMTT